MCKCKQERLKNEKKEKEKEKEKTRKKERVEEKFEANRNERSNLKQVEMKDRSQENGYVIKQEMILGLITL